MKTSGAPPRNLWLFIALGVVALSPLALADKKPANNPLAEFGSVALDISGAKAFSRLISEGKTKKQLKKATAGGLLGYRNDAGGSYAATVQGQGDQTRGSFDVTVNIEVYGANGPLRVQGGGHSEWNTTRPPVPVTTSTPDSIYKVPPATPWPHESPYKPVFRGPNAKEKRRDWERDNQQRQQDRQREEQTNLENYQRDSVRQAFEEALQEARENAEEKLRVGFGLPVTTKHASTSQILSLYPTPTQQTPSTSTAQ